MSKEEEYKETNDGYVFFKAFRKEIGWDSNATKSERYYKGDQWDAKDKRDLESKNRPASVFNMILPAVDIIIGHYIKD